MSQPFQRAIGGVTPLGVITVTPGTPINVLKNLSLATKTYSFQARQLGISVDSSPSGEVYVNYGNVAGKNANVTAMIIQSGTVTSLPANGVATEGELDLSQWYIDGSAACVVALYALDASSA